MNCPHFEILSDQNLLSLKLHTFLVELRGKFREVEKKMFESDFKKRTEMRG